MWSSSSAKVLRKSTFLRATRRRHIFPPNLAALDQTTRKSSSGSSGIKIGRWFMRKVYGTIIVVGVTTGGLLVVCTHANSFSTRLY